MACEKTTWRGVTVCKHSVAKFDRFAKAVGQAILIKAIQGSYSNGSLSAGTHSGGGALDVAAGSYTAAQARFMANTARAQVLLAWDRLWTNNWHVHILDPSCPSLSSQAAAQFYLFGQGYNGLVGNGSDQCSRTYASQIMAAFKARMSTPTTAGYVQVAGYYTVRSGDSLGEIAAAFRVTVAQLQTWNKITDPNQIAVGQRLRVVAPVVTRTVNYNYPYTYRAGFFPYPGRQGASYYGPSTPGTAWYSGKVAGGTKTGIGATGGLSLTWIRGHIMRIQRCVGATPDGRYGTATRAAVKRWQASHKDVSGRALQADGIVGPRTWAAMAKSRGQ